MHLTVLGSGSGGNSTLISEGTTRILVDAGLSAGQLQSRLEAIGVDPASLSAILLTHEHGDHVRGLEILTRKYPTPIYCSALTRQVVRESFKTPGERNWKIIHPGQSFTLMDWEITSFPVPHDAVDPLGFVFRSGARRLGILSDLGHITRAIREMMKGVHTLFVEANYDGNLLQSDQKRPYSTKQRISSQHGHLSNEQTAQFIADIAHEGLERIILGHLSSDCNKPALVTGLIENKLGVLGFTDIEIHCATQDTPTAMLPVRQRMPVAVSAPHPAGGPLTQAELF